MSGTYNLYVNQGATYARVFKWLAQSCCGQWVAGGAPGPVDLTGYGVAMQIRAYPLSATVLYDASSDITLGGRAGTITLEIPAADTEAFTWWAGVYDLLLVSPSGIVTRLLSGSVEVSAGVTSAGGQFVLLPGGQAAILPGGQGILTP